MQVSLAMAMPRPGIAIAVPTATSRAARTAEAGALRRLRAELGFHRALGEVPLRVSSDITRFTSFAP